MELPTQQQADAAIASDHLLSFIVKGGWADKATRELIETKLTEYYANIEGGDQTEALFLESALKYIREADHQ